MNEGTLNPSGKFDQALSSSSEVFDSSKIIERLIGEIEAAKGASARIRMCDTVLSSWKQMVETHPELEYLELIQEIDKRFPNLLKEVVKE